MRLLVLGGDGFCGWPSAPGLSRAGHEVAILDNLVRRRMDEELGVQSLTPMAATVVMPFALFNAARRAVLAPVLIFAVFVLVLFSQTFTGLRWQPMVATVVGLPALVSAGVCLLRRQPRAVLYVPEYLVSRLIRNYFTMAAVLSLRFDPVRIGRRARSRD